MAVVPLQGVGERDPMVKHDDYNLPLRSRAMNWLRHTWMGFKWKRYQVRFGHCGRKFFFTEKGALHCYARLAGWGSPVRLLGWDRTYLLWHVLGRMHDKPTLRRSRVSDR